ncbi:MAG: hypothetical protein KC621_27385 [Myxococcales bacterium]|nr:hypothetical protein [Myxococcales bacterium]
MWFTPLVLGGGCAPKVNPQTAAPMAQCDSRGVEVAPTEVSALGFSASDVLSAWQGHHRLEVTWNAADNPGLAAHVASIEWFDMTTELRVDAPIELVTDPQEVHSCPLRSYLRVPVVITLQAPDGKLRTTLPAYLIAPSMMQQEWLIRSWDPLAPAEASDAFLGAYLPEAARRFDLTVAEVDRIWLTLFDERPGPDGTPMGLKLRIQLRSGGDEAPTEDRLTAGWTTL